MSSNNIEKSEEVVDSKAYTDMCNCEVDLNGINLANELNLPLYNRCLLTPQVYTQPWGTFPMMDAYSMFAYMKLCEDYNWMGYECMPNLNQLATSHSTEEVDPNGNR